jgi:hypothetical protein
MNRVLSLHCSTAPLLHCSDVTRVAVEKAHRQPLTRANTVRHIAFDDKLPAFRLSAYPYFGCPLCGLRGRGIFIDMNLLTTALQVCLLARIILWCDISFLCFPRAFVECPSAKVWQRGFFLIFAAIFRRAKVEELNALIRGERGRHPRARFP